MGHNTKPLYVEVAPTSLRLRIDSNLPQETPLVPAPAPTNTIVTQRHDQTLALLCLALSFALIGVCRATEAGPHAVTPNPSPSLNFNPIVSQLQLHTSRPSADYAARPEAMAFADEWASEHGVPIQQARAILGTAKQLPAVIKLVTPAPKGFKKDWHSYRARFVEPLRLKAGRAFWRANAATLSKAEATFGVPAWLIVGVIGVESLYGQHTGKFTTLDVLSTLAFDFPKAHPKQATRQAFFRGELAAFLQLAGADPKPIDQWVGSYAGALGWPQFMPSSWQQFAVDFDNDGRIDLLNSQADVIGSVANYFKAFGWQSGMPTHYTVKVLANSKALPQLLAPDIVPSFKPTFMHNNGAKLEAAGLKHPGPLALVKLENAKGKPTYIAGTHNFYVVTRYNWSSYYALAVIELGKAIQASANNPPPHSSARSSRAE